MTPEELIEGNTKKGQIDAISAALTPLDNEAMTADLEILANIQNEHGKIVAIVDATTQTALSDLISDFLTDYLAVLTTRKEALEAEFALIGEGDA